MLFRSLDTRKRSALRFSHSQRREEKRRRQREVSAKAHGGSDRRKGGAGHDAIRPLPPTKNANLARCCRFVTEPPTSGAKELNAPTVGKARQACGKMRPCAALRRGWTGKVTLPFPLRPTPSGKEDLFASLRRLNVKKTGAHASASAGSLGVFAFYLTIANIIFPHTQWRQSRGCASYWPSTDNRRVLIKV